MFAKCLHTLMLITTALVTAILYEDFSACLSLTFNCNCDQKDDTNSGDFVLSGQFEVLKSEDTMSTMYFSVL